MERRPDRSSESIEEKFERNVKEPAISRIARWVDVNRPDLEYLRRASISGDLFVRKDERYHVTLVFPFGETFVVLAFWVDLTHEDDEGVTFIGEIH